MADKKPEEIIMQIQTKMNEIVNVDEYLKDYKGYEIANIRSQQRNSPHDNLSVHFVHLRKKGGRQY